MIGFQDTWLAVNTSSPNVHLVGGDGALSHQDGARFIEVLSSRPICRRSVPLAIAHHQAYTSSLPIAAA